MTQHVRIKILAYLQQGNDVTTNGAGVRIAARRKLEHELGLKVSNYYIVSCKK